jgi:Cdc6-like AAA superfamily ATPase
MTAPPSVETAWDWWERSSSPHHRGPPPPEWTTGVAFWDASRHPAIEVWGQKGTGKTTTLRTIAAHAVVQSMARRVLYFDSSGDGCNDVVRRWATLLQSLLWRECAVSSEGGTWEAKLLECLQRIHICVKENEGWLPILETLPQQLSSLKDEDDPPILWLWDDWDRLSPREVRQVQRVLAAAPQITFVATATKKTSHLLLRQSVHLERLGAATEYRATVQEQETQHFFYSISPTAGILS